MTLEPSCSKCGSTENLQRHHISYKPGKTIILCVDCHNKEHPNHGVGLGTGWGCNHRFNEYKEEFTKMWLAQKPYEEITKNLKISYMTIYNWTKLLNLKRRIKKGIKKPMKLNETQIETMTNDFKEPLAHILLELNAEKVTLDDTKELFDQLLKQIRNIEKTRGGLSHEWITLKSKGRFVLPRNLRTAIGAHQGTRFDAHLYPNQQKPRGILLLKEEW